MPAKSEASPAAAPEKAGAPAEKDRDRAPAGEKQATAPGPSRLPLFLAIAAVVLAPALSFAVAEFVVLPGLERKLAQLPASAAAPGDGGGDQAGGKAAPPTYAFSNVVVNLAGTMGTRYLKTSFIVTGPDPALTSLFESNKARLTDVTLNVLSSLTLADLEQPGSRNVLREKLVEAYNDALGRKVADQVYFSDFVVQ